MPLAERNGIEPGLMPGVGGRCAASIADVVGRPDVRATGRPPGAGEGRGRSPEPGRGAPIGGGGVVMPPGRGRGGNAVIRDGGNGMPRAEKLMGVGATGTSGLASLLRARDALPCKVGGVWVTAPPHAAAFAAAAAASECTSREDRGDRAPIGGNDARGRFAAAGSCCSASEIGSDRSAGGAKTGGGGGGIGRDVFTDAAGVGRGFIIGDGGATPSAAMPPWP